MSVTQDQIRERLTQVMDPELGRDLVSLGMVEHIAICDDLVKVKIALTTPACPMKDRIAADVKAAVGAMEAVKQVNVEFSEEVRRPQQSGGGSAPSGSAGDAPSGGGSGGGGGAPSGGGGEAATPQDQARASNPLPNVKHVIAVGAGKGGVGKSTVAVNLAVGLAREGASVGLMDGDIYGPSLPTLLGLHGMQATGSGQAVDPFRVHGIEAITVGKLVDPEKPLIWRGPMAHGAFRQLVTQTTWSDLDYLIIDLPPGTGDVPLTMAQLLPLTGAVVVCTPQRVAQDDARRAVRMFQQLEIEVLGVVENMSYFVGDDGKEYDIFGRGGAEKMAIAMGVPYLGGIPISMGLRSNSDEGDPSANFDEEPLAGELMQVVRNTAGRISVAAMNDAGPSLTVR